MASGYVLKRFGSWIMVIVGFVYNLTLIEQNATTNRVISTDLLNHSYIAESSQLTLQTSLLMPSRWMVVGSFGCTIFAIIPLVQQYESFYKSHDDMLPAVDFKITWALLIFSGFFFTLGSFAFVRYRSTEILIRSSPIPSLTVHFLRVDSV